MKCACTIFPSLACQAILYFSTLSHMRHDLKKNRKMYVLVSSTTFSRNISHSKKKWAKYDHKRVLVFV